MDIFYDKHDKAYKKCITDKERIKIADSWLNFNTVDYWRHNRMLELLKPFLNKDEKWLTIGDGRYGSEAAWLKKNGIDCHASDMHTNLLEVASKKGIIDSFSKQNAENLDFENDTFDYVLIKESLHHLPRPWLALYESFRVCKKAVIVIEPNDPFPYGNLFRILFIKFKNIYKRFSNKSIYKNEYGFEEVGNFIYTINIRELEKFLLGMHKTTISFKKLNDHYLDKIEYIRIDKSNFKEKIVYLKLRSIIFLKNVLSTIGFLNYSLSEVVLFKEKPNLKTINKLKKYKWSYKRLPNNPYL